MTEAETRSDTELALQAQAGNKHAFDQLVLRLKGPLFRFARRYVGNDDDAYDIIQESFISAWMALGRYDRQKPFMAWLRAIALNKCRDFGRRQAVRRRFLRIVGLEKPDIRAEDEADLRSEQEAREDRRLSRLNQAIVALPAFYKEPLLLITVNGLSQQEVADQLKTSAKAIEMRIRRARKKLTKALSDPAEK